MGCTVRAVASNMPDLRVALIRHFTELFNGCSCGIKPIVENKDWLISNFDPKLPETNQARPKGENRRGRIFGKQTSGNNLPDNLRVFTSVTTMCRVIELTLFLPSQPARKSPFFNSNDCSSSTCEEVKCRE